jgi:hypothetical protein
METVIVPATSAVQTSAQQDFASTSALPGTHELRPIWDSSDH